MKVSTNTLLSLRPPPNGKLIRSNFQAGTRKTWSLIIRRGSRIIDL